MITVPELGDEFHAMWSSLFDLTGGRTPPWALIGAHMVALHGWAADRQQIRPSRDADLLVDVRAVTNGTEQVSVRLIELGFALDGYSPEGVGHRFKKGEVRIDVLGPDGVGHRANLRTSEGAHTVRVPGGSQALIRSALVQVRSRDLEGAVLLPSLTGALLVKVRAIDVGDEPDAQRQDVGFLLSLVVDPKPIAAEISNKERGWMRRHMYLGDPESHCYRLIDGAEDAAIVFNRLVS